MSLDQELSKRRMFVQGPQRGASVFTVDLIFHEHLSKNNVYESVPGMFTEMSEKPILI